MRIRAFGAGSLAGGAALKVRRGRLKEEKAWTKPAHLLLAVPVVFLGCATGSGTRTPGVPDPPAPSNLEVARIEGDTIRVHHDRMRWTF